MWLSHTCFNVRVIATDFISSPSTLWLENIFYFERCQQPSFFCIPILTSKGSRYYFPSLWILSIFLHLSLFISHHNVRATVTSAPKLSISVVPTPGPGVRRTLHIFLGLSYLTPIWGVFPNKLVNSIKCVGLGRYPHCIVLGLLEV